MEDEVMFLLKTHDIDLVEMAIAAMGPDVDLAIEIERLAATFFLAAGSPASTSRIRPDGGWRADLMQPFYIEKVVVGPVKDQAKQFGLDRDFPEHPIQQQKRPLHGIRAMLNINIAFEPTGRLITKNVPRLLLVKWEMQQECERKMTVPSHLHFLLEVTNGGIIGGLIFDHEKLSQNVGESRKLEGISTISPKAQGSINLSTNSKKTLSTVMNPCRVCGALCTMKCSRCHKVHYCSPEHIKSVRIHSNLY
jgi:hypothetical protein